MNHIGHHHHHSLDSAGRGLRLAAILTLGILALELVAGYLADSLALLSDAGHLLTDVVALGLAWYATRLSQRPPSEANTFGYRRSGILAALANATTLLVIAIFVAIEAIVRLRHPQHVEGVPVVLAALTAIGVNVFIARSLRAEGYTNLNVSAALLHVMGDIGASAAVVVSGLVILLWRFYLIDPLLSLAIAAFIAYGAWQLVRDTTAILMEGTPRGVELDRLRAAMLEVPGVEDVHDLHVWALSDGFRLLTAHVMVPNQSLADSANLLADLKMVLHQRFHIEHATIEVECTDCQVPLRRPIRFEGAASRPPGA